MSTQNLLLLVISIILLVLLISFTFACIYLDGFGQKAGDALVYLIMAIKTWIEARTKLMEAERYKICSCAEFCDPSHRILSMLGQATSFVSSLASFASYIPAKGIG